MKTLFEDKLLKASSWSDVDKLMNQLDTEITEGLFDSLRIEQNNKYHVYTVRNHIIYTVLNTRPDVELRWAALMHDIGKKKALTVDKDGNSHFYWHPDMSVEMAQPFLEKLGYENETLVNILTLIKLHDKFDSSIKVIKVRELIGTYGENIARKLVELKEADIKSQSELSYDLKIQNLKELQRLVDIVSINGTGITEEHLHIDKMELNSICGEYTDDIIKILLKNVWGNPDTNKESILMKLVNNELKKLRKR